MLLLVTILLICASLQLIVLVSPHFVVGCLYYPLVTSAFLHLNAVPVHSCLRPVYPGQTLASGHDFFVVEVNLVEVVTPHFVVETSLVVPLPLPVRSVTLLLVIVVYFVVVGEFLCEVNLFPGLLFSCSQILV